MGEKRKGKEREGKGGGEDGGCVAATPLLPPAGALQNATENGQLSKKKRKGGAVDCVTNISDGRIASTTRAGYSFPTLMR